MLKAAFSTLACPHWELDRVAQAARDLNYDGVELRTLGFGPTDLVSDPATTAPEKVRRILADAGIQPVSLAASISFDAPIRPRVIGRVIGDQEKQVRQAKRMIDLAVEIECPYVRFFAGRRWDGETRKRTIARIAERAYAVADHADKTGVSVLIENSGDFASAQALAELIDAIAHPLVAASYSSSIAYATGDDPAEGTRLLADRLRIAKVKDLKHGRPALPGTGDIDCRAFTRSSLSSWGRGQDEGFSSISPWLVFEWDKAWLPDLADPEQALPAAADFFASLHSSNSHHASPAASL